MGKSIFAIFVAAIMTPVIKQFIEYFTTPTTGYLVTIGVDEGTIAMINLIPWIFPLFAIIYVIVHMSKPADHDDEQDRRFPPEE